MPDKDEVTITEISEFEPTRVDGVGKGANGFPILMLKSIDGNVQETEISSTDIAAEIEKANDGGYEGDEGQGTDGADDNCKTCKGKGTIRDGHMKCPDCFGKGLQPLVGETVQEFSERVAKLEGSAPSGSGPTPAHDCPTCNGSGTIPAPGQGSTAGGPTQCPDCGGTGMDEPRTNPSELNAVDGFPGSISEGDPQGRERIDKAAACGCCDDCKKDQGDTEGCDCCDKCGDAVKADMSTSDINDLPDSDFAYIEDGGQKDDGGKTTPRSLRHFPINDAAHVRNALARVSQSPFGDKAMPKIKAAADKFDIEVSKADASMVTGSNPNATVTGVDDGTSTPGSPAWESIDAATATAAATALMNAAELIRQFAQREAQEVIAGEGNDVFDTMAAQAALAGVSDALGIMAQLAFHESVAAQKGAVEKAGKRLSGRSVSALAAARDKAKELDAHLTGLLGDDDPSKSDDKTNKDDSGKSAAAKFIDKANKALLAKELENMSTDELEKVLDERDDKLVKTVAAVFAEAMKGKSAMDTTDGIAGGKAANKKSKTKDVGDTDDTLEDEADQGDSDSANTSPSGAAKSEGEDDAETAEKSDAEMTPEEIEARDERKAAKKALKAAKRAEKQAADNAAVAKAIEEGVAEARKAVDNLQERLAEVEKRAAPSTIVRTRPQDAITKGAERDAIDMRIASLEREARETPDPDIRKASREEASELRAKLAELNKN